MISLDAVLGVLEYYKYIAIFPIAIIEGPIIGVISGFFIFLGILQPVPTYILLVIADLIGDSLYYGIGRVWQRSPRIKRWAGYLGYTDENENYLVSHFSRHKYKTFLVAKFSHGIGGSIQIASGIAKVNYWEYLWINFIGTLPKVMILMAIGYLIGDSYSRIDQYLNSFALVTFSILVLILLFFIVRKYMRKRKEKIL